jgi:hypothetical protein
VSVHEKAVRPQLPTGGAVGELESPKSSQALTEQAVLNDGHDRHLVRRFAHGNGPPGLPPGIYFRLLLIGYFEGRTMALGAMLTVLWMLIDEGITAIWSPPRDRTRSDRPLLGFLVAELVA